MDKLTDAVRGRAAGAAAELRHLPCRAEGTGDPDLVAQQLAGPRPHCHDGDTARLV